MPGTAVWYPSMFAVIAPIISPVIIPDIPPVKNNIMDSVINCILMELFLAVNDLRVPVSSVLSVTGSIIMPATPAISDIPAIIAAAIVTVSIILYTGPVTGSITETMVS